jgi:hypothetical protein
MKNEHIRKKWEEFIGDDKYKVYFLSNSESWISTLNKIKLYISENNRLPSKNSKNCDIKKLAIWLLTQLRNYKKQVQIMKDDNIRELWEKFIREYKQYFN